jgi:transcriptional regulator with XRE-family HTH domain
MARPIRTTRQPTGLYHAREASGMSRSELVRLSGVSKQQLSRLEGGQIRLRLDHLKPFASHLGYTPEQILLWGRYPGTGSSDAAPSGAASDEIESSPGAQVPEIDNRLDQSGTAAKGARKPAHPVGPIKSEKWMFPGSFVHEQLHSSPDRLVVLDTNGDSMVPTIASGERVIVDTGHKTPSPDGLYAIRDALGSVVVKRLQVMRSARPPHVKIISDNPNHPSEEAALRDVEIIGKVLCCLKLF